MENDQELQDDMPVQRLAPTRRPGEQKIYLRKHKWVYGVPEKVGDDNKRKDFCRYCGCTRDVTIPPNKHEWIDGYTLRGENFTHAPKCE